MEVERQQSLHTKATEKLQSFKIESVEKRKSFQTGAMESQKSFSEKKSKGGSGKRGDTLLHLAARAGNAVYVMKILLDCDSSHLKDLVSTQNKDGETALYVAAEGGHAGVVHEILKVSDVQAAGLRANNGFDPFLIAAKRGHWGVLKELLHSFPSLAMATNSSNATALDIAATQGHINVVNLLLRDPRLLRIARSNGKTALHSAARIGHAEVVKSILSKDPDIGSRTDKKGQTALHMAVKGHNVDVVLELLKNNPSLINMKDNKGNTPLHIATRKGRSEILQILLSIEGIDINAVNRAGETALGIAEKNHNEEITLVLREVGAIIIVENVNPPSAAKHLNQTVSDIKHNVQSQLRHARQTERRVQRIRKRLGKLHLGGLNNAINSSNVVAVLIATVAFAALFTVPGQYVEEPEDGFTLGEAYIAKRAAFIIFLLFDSLALFISLAVVVVQTSLIVVERKAKKQMVFVINKLMWLACLFISISFISVTYIVISHKEWWLAWATVVIGASIMLSTLGSMCYCMIVHRINRSNWKNTRSSGHTSYSGGGSLESDSEILSTDYKTLYAL